MLRESIFEAALLFIAMLALPALGGLAVGELAYRIALMKRFGLRYNRGRRRHMDECRAAAAMLGPQYRVFDADDNLLMSTHNASDALRASIGVSGATVYKDGVLVLRNRTLVQAGGK